MCPYVQSPNLTLSVLTKKKKRLPSDKQKDGFQCVPVGREGLQKDDGIISLRTTELLRGRLLSK